MKTSILRASLCGFVIVLLFVAARADGALAEEYTLEVICPTVLLSGKNMAINENGDVAGQTDYWFGNSQGFFYRNGQFYPLDMQPDALSFGVNDSGQVTGYIAIGNHQVFVYDNGTLTNMGSYGSTNAQGRDINNAGVIAGYREGYAVTYSGDQYTEICEGAALGINNAGQVVGMHYQGNPYPSSAFLYNNGQLIDLTPANLSSAAFDINESGHVVGRYDDLAFLWKDGTLQNLGTFADSSIAYGINDYDQVVGICKSNSFQERAFIFDDGVMYDLNDFLPEDSPFNTLKNAMGINNQGQIVGYGSVKNPELYYEDDPWLYTDYIYVMTPVPEPTTLLLLGLGALSLRARRSRR